MEELEVNLNKEMLILLFRRRHVKNYVIILLDVLFTPGMTPVSFWLTFAFF